MFRSLAKLVKVADELALFRPSLQAPRPRFRGLATIVYARLDVGAIERLHRAALLDAYTSMQGQANSPSPS
jgi:hypothetical protein